MSSRRTHAKSRRGCTNCKRRHVRCDEAGPPCTRCRERGDDDCDYTRTVALKDSSSSSTVTPQLKDPVVGGPSHQVDDISRARCANCTRRHIRCDKTGPPCTSCKQRGFQCEYTESPASSDPIKPIHRNPHTVSPSTVIAPTPQQEPSEAAVFPPTSSLLELQLMHRWTALTYKSCCTPGSGDEEVWQIKVPRLAIQYEYLRHAIFSLAAFESARSKPEVASADQARFLHAAVEYHSWSLGTFRAALEAALEAPLASMEDFEAKLCMSMMLMVLLFASAQVRGPGEESADMVETVLTHVKLLRGAEPILASNKDYLVNNTYVKRLKLLVDLDRTPLPETLERAFAQLMELNDKRVTASARDTDDQRRLQEIERWEACKKGLAHLRDLFEKCGDDYSRGYALGWLNMAGDGYVQAVVDGDAVALIMLMFWGVLAEQCGRQVWWAEEFGVKLVEELARLPAFTNAGDDVRSLVAQAEGEVKAAARET